MGAGIGTTGGTGYGCLADLGYLFIVFSILSGTKPSG